jgi:hypothetical protein
MGSLTWINAIRDERWARLIRGNAKRLAWISAPFFEMDGRVETDTQHRQTVTGMLEDL